MFDDFNKIVDDNVKKIMLGVKQTDKIEERCDYVGSESIGEVIEKLLILNIRIWHLEDLAGIASKENNTEEYVRLKRIIDYCFKKRRPALVAALDAMVAGTENINIKSYGGIK